MNTFKLSNVSVAKMRKLLIHQGFTYSHTNGDHEIWTKEGATRPCVLPTSKDPVAEFIVKNLMKIMGLSRKEAKEIIPRL